MLAKIIEEKLTLSALVYGVLDIGSELSISGIFWIGPTSFSDLSDNSDL